MTSLSDVIAAIEPIDVRIGRATAAQLDAKTKPKGSLGRLEALACQIAAVRRRERPESPKKAIIVMGADHGVVEEGVSAYPQEVTAQMLLNFARGGAAINVLARQAGARVVVVDVGTKTGVSAPEILERRIRPGTENFVRGPAMQRAEALAAVQVGVDLVRTLVLEGFDLVGLGEMGIGNTTSASAIAAALTGSSPEEVCGRGTGLDDAGLRRKIAAVRAGLVVNTPDPGDPIDVLAKVGGLEIAGLAGVVLASAACRVPVVMDGFIASTAALVAVRLAPRVAEYVIAAHRSVEVGHRVVLAAIGAKPLLDLDLRLGEGTGAALAMGLVDASLHVLHDMATFESAGVTGAS